MRAFVLSVASVVLVAILYALPVMLLWNWLMPGIFGVPGVGVLQAMGICLLSALLFKSGASK